MSFLFRIGLSKNHLVLFRMIDFARPEYTMLRPMRLKMLYDLSNNIKENGVEGNIIECGVYQGGAAMIMAEPHKEEIKSGKRKVYLFDSFEGNPAPSAKDGPEMQNIYHPGFAKGRIEKVREIFSRWGLMNPNIHIVKGWFSETLSAYPKNKIALIHIDANLYESTKICLESLADLVQRGGYMVFDDYGTRAKGCTKAIDEFFQSRQITPDLKTYDNFSYYYKKDF